MGYEDFTGYTEVDPNSHIERTANHADANGLTRGEDAYLYYDKGAAYFGDFTHYVDLKPVSGTAWGYGAGWALTNDIDDLQGIKTAGQTAIAIQMFRLGDASRVVKVIEIYLSASYAGTGIAVSLNTQYYGRIYKSGTTFRIRLWTNSSDRDNDDTGAGSYVGESSLTLHADHTFRYVFAINTYNAGAGTQTVTFDVDNLDLAPGAPPPAGQPYISRVQRITGMRSWGGISSFYKRFPAFKPRKVS